MRFDPPRDDSTGFTILATGQSNSVSVGESIEADRVVESNILVWDPRSEAFVAAVYGRPPLNNKGADGTPACNHQVAFANELRRSGLLPPTVPIRIIRVASGGCSIANWVALKHTSKGEIQGQFLINRLWETVTRSAVSRIDLVLFHQGETDSVGAREDTVEGGRFAPDGFGNTAAGLLADAVNPVHPRFSLPAAVADAVAGAGGFNTLSGYRAAHQHLVAMLRSFPQIGPTTPIICAELTQDWKTLGTARNDYFTAVAAGHYPFLLGVGTAGLETSSLPNQTNHLTSKGQNALGERMFAKWLEAPLGASSAGLNDLYGNKIANRYAMRVVKNVDQDGRRQGNGDYYVISTDQLRNGISVVVEDSTIILPQRLGRVGGVDAEFWLRVTQSGPASLCCKHPIAGLQGGIRAAIDGVDYWKYAASRQFPVRLTSGLGNWRMIANSSVPTLNRGGRIGVASPQGPVVMLSEAACGNVCYECAAGIICVLPDPNVVFAQNHGCRIVLVASLEEGFRLDTIAGASILDGTGTLCEGTGGASASLSVGRGVAILLEPAMRSRWVVLNGQVAASPERRRSAVSVAVESQTVDLSSAAHWLLQGGGALANLTLRLPAAPPDGDMRHVDFSASIKRLSVEGGDFVEGFSPPAAIAQGDRLEFVFSVAAGSAWLCRRSGAATAGAARVPGSVDE
jgi:hypothetical protein